ncbi:hypothetical protein ACFPIJ_23940 [Dactylosporangium cerinum]|uniref:Uncharacterized protein n=1 Tax=Dactylosporangium cerinum TaxID=1434730 RepID=A0ABV9VZN1_9ACTN
MTERDPLRTHFDAFQERSTSTAIPPSVEEIPRRLRRTRRRRTVAVVLAALALIALVTVPSWRNSGPPPIPTNSPTPTPSASPSPSSSAVVAAPPPVSPSSTSASGASSSRGATCTTSARGNPMVNGVEAQLTQDYGTTMIPKPANLFEVCPAARLAFVKVIYDWSIDRQQYVLVSNVSYALTQSQPSMTRPKPSVVSSCGGIVVLIVPGRSVPSSIPRSVQDSAQPNSAAYTYLGKSGQVIMDLIEIYSYSNVTSRSYCVPASPPA